MQSYVNLYEVLAKTTGQGGHGRLHWLVDPHAANGLVKSGLLDLAHMKMLGLDAYPTMRGTQFMGGASMVDAVELWGSRVIPRPEGPVTHGDRLWFPGPVWRASEGWVSEGGA